MNKTECPNCKKTKKLCAKNQNFYFVSTEEQDIFNLKDTLGKKLNQTPLKKTHWK